MAAHDAGHVGADGIEPGDGVAVPIEYLRVFVGLEAGKGAEATRLDLDGIEWPLLDGRHAWVWPMHSVALLAVVGGGAATELRVLAQSGMAVVLGNGFA
ncbi:hypothetical protein D3C76_1057530 [compost metagenome]